MLLLYEINNSAPWLHILLIHILHTMDCVTYANFNFVCCIATYMHMYMFIQEVMLGKPIYCTK